MKHEIIPGFVYKHFKGDKYYILNLAEHTETGETMVVYSKLEDAFKLPQKLYVRPYSMMVSKVDKEKYPDVEQEYRFEEVGEGEI